MPIESLHGKIACVFNKAPKNKIYMFQSNEKSLYAISQAHRDFYLPFIWRKAGFSQCSLRAYRLSSVKRSLCLCSCALAGSYAVKHVGALCLRLQHMVIRAWLLLERGQPAYAHFISHLIQRCPIR